MNLSKAVSAIIICMVVFICCLHTAKADTTVAPTRISYNQWRRWFKYRWIAYEWQSWTYFLFNTAFSGFFVSIAQAEGTYRDGQIDYDAVYGNGLFGYPSKKLTDMTVSEVESFGRNVLGPNSDRGTSAVGAFQIEARTTLPAAAAKLNIKPNDKFTPSVQRLVATWIKSKQGLNAWQGFHRHPVLKRRAEHAWKKALEEASYKKTATQAYIESHRIQEANASK